MRIAGESFLRGKAIGILPGQYFDAETGLHQNWYRDYDPGIGRYLQPDPTGLDDGPSVYAYVDANPLRYFDPNGHSKVTGQANPGGNDPAVAGVGKQSSQVEIDAAKKRVQEVLKDPNASPKRKAFLRGWLKLAKRGFTKAFCPPLLEDLVRETLREACLTGSPGACEAYQTLEGGEDAYD